MTERIELDTGSLSKRELQAILDSLPVDVSFVGKDNTVRYFNREKKRIFPRTKEVIGRRVQDCHPKKSLEKVNQIIEAFRDGKKNSAEFWIDMKGRKVNIRYFAVRDSKGGYMGTLEMSQDITDIQKLKGERRLLDWR